MEDAAELTYLCFQLGERWFALEAAEVESVIQEAGLTPVPGTPPHVLGVIAHHGHAIALLDTALLLGVDDTDESGEGRSQRPLHRRIVVVKRERMTVGLLADRNVEIAAIPARWVRPSRFAGEGRLKELVSAEFDHQDRVVTRLDLEKLLSAARV